MWRLLCLGLTLSWSACQPVQPLKKEFSRAVQARQPTLEDMPVVEDEAAVERFIQRHGREALPLYRKIIEQFAHTADSIELLELVAAIEGYAAVEGASSLPVLRELALDVRVPAVAMEAVFEQLENLSRDDAILIMGERLLAEEDVNGRRRIVSLMRETGNPGAIPFLTQALAREQDKSLRVGMERVLRLLQKPDVCQLSDKAFGIYSKNGDEWWCNYECPGPQPGYAMSLREECPDTEPLPRRRVKKKVP